MIDTTLIITILVLVVGFYMAWNIGANDVSNAMGTSVGSGALTLFRAVLIAAVLEFAGAYFAGSHVSQTLQKGIIDTNLFLSDPMVLILGMVGALLGTGIWLQIASYFGWPVSTTHAIVGAIIGFGFIVGGTNAVQWNEVGSIALSWILCPLVAGIIAYLMFTFIQKKILFAHNPITATRKIFPFLTFIFFGALSLNLVYKGLGTLNFHLNFFQGFLVAVGIGLIASFITYIIIKQIPLSKETFLSKTAPHSVISLGKATKHLQRVRLAGDETTAAKAAEILAHIKTLTAAVRKETRFEERTSGYREVEKMFITLQIFSACFIAFSHGANDVSNAIGPIAAVLDLLKNGALSEISTVPSWLLAFGGVGIIIGLATWGWRVIETIGKKITQLTPTRGFSAEFGAATTILFASKLGLPVSTTHCLVGAILGVGIARGISSLNLGTLRDIALSWIVTLPAAALVSVTMFYLLKALFI